MSKVQYIMKASVDEMIDLRDFLLSVEGYIVEGVDHFAALRPMFEQFVGRDPELKNVTWRIVAEKYDPIKGRGD